MKIKLKLSSIIFFCLIFFFLLFIINRINSPQKNMVVVKKNTTYREIVWNYGIPDVSTGGFYVDSISVSHKIILYRIDKDTSYQLMFYGNKLCSLNIISKGIVVEKGLK